jgi:serine/threonine protein kinase
MLTSPQVIGEGAYGCIHKPSLKCKRGNHNYTRKVSKILKKRNADKEMREFRTISKIDATRKYHLGKPDTCIPSSDYTNYMAIHKCVNRDQFSNINDTKLLIMEDGGEDLIHFVGKMHRASPTQENTERMHRFWIELRRIIYAIQDLVKHKVIHHDIKMGNIVYSEADGRMNLIDFGLMTTFSKIFTASLKSDNWLSQIFWSFPFEIHFYNKNTYMEFAKKSVEEKKDFVQMIQTNLHQNKADLFSKAFRTFFSDVISKNSLYQESTYFQEFEETLMKEMIPKNYSKFIRQSLKTVDLYGLGIALMYLLHHTSHLITQKLFEDLEPLFFEMIRPNYIKRIPIEKMLNKYDEILEINGIEVEEKRFGGELFHYKIDPLS